MLAAGAAHAAEVYNKDGNKLDLYGKVDGLHYFSDNLAKDGDQSYARLGFKGKPKLSNIHWLRSIGIQSRQTTLNLRKKPS
ncbi:porin [Escherichia coli]